MEKFKIFIEGKETTQEMDINKYLTIDNILAHLKQDME